MEQKLKAVIFDFDGTLADSLQIWRRVDEIFFEKRGMIFDETVVEFGGKSFSECAAYIKDLFSLPESVEAIKQEWIELSIPLYGGPNILKPCAKEFVSAVKAAGLKTAIGTSNNQDIIRPVLQKNGMADLFDHVLTCCEAGRGKPYPDVYLAIATELGVQPDECVVFEDTLEGIMAAKNAGMRVYAVHDPAHEAMRHEIESAADRYIEGFCFFHGRFDNLLEII